jgi:hypothetical protein
MRYFVLLVMCLCVFVCVTLAGAGPITDSIAYQGRLTDATDNAVPDGPRDLTISIWTDSVGGTMLYSQVGLVTVSKGLFSTCVGCGSGSFFDIFTDQPLFLQMQLAGQPAMVPRTRLRYAPRALVSSRVRGDISTSPGRVAVGDVNGNGVSVVAINDSSAITVGDPNIASVVSSVGNLAGGAGGGAAAASYAATGRMTPTGLDQVKSQVDSSGPSIVIAKGVVQVARIAADNDTTHLEMSGKRPGRAKFSNIVMKAFDEESRVLQATDVDGDGSPESSVMSSSSATSAKHAINTKGAGSGDRSISSTTTSSSALHVVEADLDGDGTSDESIASTITPTVTQHAINTKGAGSGDRTISSAIYPDSMAQVLSSDADGDGVPECKESVSLGIGFTAVKGTFRSTNRVNPNTTTETRASDLEGVCRVAADSDDDGLSDADASLIVTPTTSSVAINTKGTGAEKNRVIGSTDDTSAAVLLGCDGASISMKVINSGAVKGNIIVMQAGRTMIGLGSDGNGYFDHGIGVGMVATHPVDIAGGAYCDGANWVNASDADLKENFHPVDGQALLEKIDCLPVSEWNYKTQDQSQKHIGPTAQDFQATFGVGSDGKSISTIDPSGIALAAIKELNKKNERLEKENQILRKEMDDLKKLVQKLASDK